MELEKRLQKYISKKNLKLISKISKGYSSEVYLVQNAKKQKFALKIEKDKSPRTEMVKRETANLKLANSISIGPKLIDFDLKSRIILMEFIEGKTFSGWLFSYPSKKALSKFLVELFSQAQRLDKIGLDHGQLAGKGKNILVRKNLPVIIDFEKASPNRRPHNVNQLASFIVLNKNSEITKKIKLILKN